MVSVGRIEDLNKDPAVDIEVDLAISVLVSTEVNDVQDPQMDFQNVYTEVPTKANLEVFRLGTVLGIAKDIGTERTQAVKLQNIDD